jgi:hypothetical protein
MYKSVARRFLITLLAVFLTASMGLSAVQASSMQAGMMDMGMATNGGDAMSMPMPVKCPDCDRSGAAKGMPSCVASACTALSALPPHSETVHSAELGLLDLRPLPTRLLNGRNSVPDPYPPRTSDIV